MSKRIRIRSVNEPPSPWGLSKGLSRSVLVDTTVWIDHFLNGNDVLSALVELDLVLMHPMVIVEIACGSPPEPRTQTLNNLALLQPCRQVGMSEVIAFIERENLYGTGCGLLEMTLLASTLLTPRACLWTLDNRLNELANRFGVAYRSR